MSDSFLISLGIGSPAGVKQFLTLGLEIASPVSVPDVVGETQAQATTDLGSAGLSVAVQQAASNTVAVGKVISQTPAAGSLVAPGSTITITLSKGAASTAAGRKHKRYYVEVDGVRFDVDDAEQARAVLERAKSLAREAAEQSAHIIERTHRITTETIAPVKLSAPRIKASPELRLPLKSVRRSINKIYREKSVILELRMWLELERRLQEDEDEAMLLLN